MKATVRIKNFFPISARTYHLCLGMQKEYPNQKKFTGLAKLLKCNVIITTITVLFIKKQSKYHTTRKIQKVKPKTGPYTERESPRSLVTFSNVCFITTNRLLPLILPNKELYHFRPMFGFYIPWKHKPLRFRVSSGGIRRKHWCEMI